jgi:hypothetical protein
VDCRVVHRILRLEGVAQNHLRQLVGTVEAALGEPLEGTPTVDLAPRSPKAAVIGVSARFIPIARYRREGECAGSIIVSHSSRVGH